MTFGRRRPGRALPGLFLGVTLTAVTALLSPLVPAGVAAPLGAAQPDGGPVVQADTDVYIRDYVGDVGVEPHTNTVWTSPDIKVCNDPGCAVSENPEVGGTSYIYVNLNNPGPYGSGDDVGNLHLYHSMPGGGTAWGGTDWVPIGSALNVVVPAGTPGTVAIIPWATVPGPGHFCLLARWESVDDPMTYPEGVNTVVNTQNNNNIAWRNVNSVDLEPGMVESRPYALGNPGRERIATDLVLADPRNGFLAAGGRLTVDLGADLSRRWREGGGRATGVKQVGETRFEISDLRQARFYGVLLDGGTRPVLKLEFSTVAGARKGTHVLRVNQIAPLDRGNPAISAPVMSDVGGVEYHVTIR